MKKRNDGGSAFPYDKRASGHGAGFGMSLRDWFAGQALAGISESLHPKDIIGLMQGVVAGDAVAKASYAIADAMIKAREA